MPVLNATIVRILAVFETVLAVTILTWYYFTAFRTTQQTSDKLFYFLRVTRGLDEKASGLHHSWYTELVEQIGDPFAAFTTPCRENIGHIYYTEPRERLLDLKDAQWHSFRDALPFVFVIASIHVCGSHAARKWGERNSTSITMNASTNKEVIMNEAGDRARLLFSLIFSLVLLGFLHEVGTVWVLLATLANFGLVRSTKYFKLNHTFSRALLWLANLSVLLAVQLDSNVWTLAWWCAGTRTETQAWAGWLDGMKGEVPWRTPFNLLILRLLSFGLDTVESRVSVDIAAGSTKCESQTRSDVNEKSKAQSVPITRTTRGLGAKQNIHSSVLLYFAYALYPPLYIAGPIMTFDDFASQVSNTTTSCGAKQKKTACCPISTPSVIQKMDRHHLASASVAASSVSPSTSNVDWSEVRQQGARVLFSFLIFEILNHYLYAGVLMQMSFNYHVGGSEAAAAIASRPDDTSFLVDGNVPMLYYMTDLGRDMVALAMYSYWALIFLWFKFLLIWTTFRLWALLDGVRTVDNMQACMNMHYTISGFWRSWHRSFNKWLVRYIYLPMGGNRRHKWMNVTAVFTFVALWHDISLDLIVWGWAFALLMIPEAIVQHVATWPWVRYRMSQLPPPAQRALVATAGACNVLLLKAANLVGYTTGVQGMRLMRPLVTTWDGVRFLLWYWMCMWAGVVMMLRIRGWSFVNLSTTVHASKRTD